MSSSRAVPLTGAAPRLLEIWNAKYCGAGRPGPGPRLRQRFGYFTPDDWYEAMVDRFVTRQTAWLDVGSGRHLFPSNPGLAVELSRRCHLLVGMDPSDNIEDNPFVHERQKCLLQDFVTDRTFDLITLRMVAEHVVEPQSFVTRLSELAKPGSRVVVYTVNKWSPVAVLTALTPMPAHHFAKRILWNGEQRDTFPTAFRMNTRTTLTRLFKAAGFLLDEFYFLDDCRSFQRWRFSNIIELSLWKALRAIGLHYPEVCILASFVRNGA